MGTLAPLRRVVVMIAVVALVAAGCGGDEEAAPAGTDAGEGADTAEEPGAEHEGHATVAARGEPLTQDEIQELAALFDHQPLTGGQVPPRRHLWVNDDTSIFLQFDNPDPAQATELRYLGVMTKGVFCAEAQPDAEEGGFTHFHQLDAPEYGQGHGGEPGEQGYWLQWLAVDAFTARDGREVTPGIDYEFSPTPPPECGADVPEPDFEGPDAGPLDADGIAALAAAFGDEILTGGQTPPRLYRWVNEQAAIFAQFDERDPAEATALPYVGLSVAGVFCQQEQPRDFPHFHRTNAADYREGHGGEPGEPDGAWLAWLATDSFTTGDDRQVTPGIDREFSPTPAPQC